MLPFTSVFIVLICAMMNPFMQSSEASLDNCASINPTAILLEGSLVPENITIPGLAHLNANLMFTKNMPTDLHLKLEITKVEPSMMQIPCLLGVIGSCEYDVCAMLTNGTICPIFPVELPCRCPLIQGAFQLPPIPLSIPNLPGFAALMRGRYIGKAIMYSKANPTLTIGCLEFHFRLTA